MARSAFASRQSPAANKLTDYQPPPVFSEATKVSAFLSTFCYTLLSMVLPEQVPPFALIADISVTGSVPEPSTWGMMALGFAGLGYAGYRARRRTSAAIA
jgi:PEP-CTERM motif